MYSNIYKIKLTFLRLTILGLTMLVLMAACQKKEEPLLPSIVPEDVFTLPQGNHPYDNRIVEFSEKYASFLLYQFTARDAYWAVVANNEILYKLIPADDKFVDEQLDLIEESFFNFYPDSTLKKFLPIKVLLCSSLTVGTTTGQVDALFLASNTAAAGYQTFAVNWGNASVKAITKLQRNSFKSNINYSFLRMMDITGKMSRSAEFMVTSDYVTALTASTVVAKNTRGFLGTGAIPIIASDWHAYLSVILNNPYTTLTNANVLPTDATAKGILSPVKDVNGLIRKKYNYMVDFYKNQYNIDIQKIGDIQL